MTSYDVHLSLATLKQKILHIWQAKKEDLKSAEDFVNAQIIKEKCNKLARMISANVAEMIESLESLLASECEDISHAFQAVKVAAENNSGRAKMLIKVAYYKDKLYGEWTTMKDRAKDAEYVLAAQEAKVQCLALEALQMSDDMLDEDLAATKTILAHSSEAIRAAKRLRIL